MKKHFTATISLLCVAAMLLVCFTPTVYAEGEPTPDELLDEQPAEQVLVASTYDEFVAAVDSAQNGATITIAGIIQIPVAVEIDSEGKALILHRGSPTAGFIFEHDSSGAPETVFSGFVFDGAGISSFTAYVSVSHNARFSDVRFINSRREANGGAVSVYNGTAYFVGCTFDSNSALQGGHLELNGEGKAVIEGCTLTNRKADYRGGAILCGGTGNTCSISGSVIANNEAGIVGGALCGAGELIVDTTQFYGNSAAGGGADIAFEQWGRLRLLDNLETLTSVFADTDLVPLGWAYDYDSSIILPFSGDIEFIQYMQLRLKFEETGSIEQPPTEPEPTPITPPSGNSGSTSRPTSSDTSPEPADVLEPQEETGPPRFVCGDAVLDPTRHDYLLGYGDSVSGQNAPITRTQAATVIFRLLTTDSLNAVYSETGSFLDVSDGDWYSVLVNTLQNAGIVNGCGGDMFRPERNLTLAEMITLFTRFVEPQMGQTVLLEH